MNAICPFLLAACGLLAVHANGQQVLFSEDFESGFGAWSSTGLWNLATAADPCASSFGVFPSGSHVAWYGDALTCTFDTGATNSGILAQNAWIDLPLGAQSITLRYWASSASEYCSGGSDQHELRLLTQNAPDDPESAVSFPYCYDAPGVSWNDLPWHERYVDLTPLRGARIRITFLFFSGDAGMNNGRGWLIDDVRVLAESGRRYCPPSGFDSGCPCSLPAVPAGGGCPNSLGRTSTLHSDGAPIVSADTLRIHAVQLPASTVALLVQGTETAQSLFGDGLRCIGGSQLRIGVQTAVGGSVSWPAPGEGPLSVRGQIPPALVARCYSVLYRDGGSYCTSAQFNMTDAQMIRWSP